MYFKMSILCIYAYYEKNSEYRDNLRYFLKHGVNDSADFVFVINGNCTLNIPSKPNITVIRRENAGYDFGAYTAAIDHFFKEDNIQHYDYFFFLNTSVRGPFLPSYSRHRLWQDAFIDMLRGDVKMVGTTINILTTPLQFFEDKGIRIPYSHVQSQMFAMDKECFEYLHPLIFADDATHLEFGDVVEQKEIAMSQYVLQNGWNINCVLPKYRDLDYRTLDADINPSSIDGDPSFAGKYFKGTYTPNDVIFIKTNRDLLQTSLAPTTTEHFCKSSLFINTQYVYSLICGLSIIAIVSFLIFKKIRR